MNVRKQILVAVVATLGTPLVAAAATQDAWYAPLSARAGVERSETENVAGDDSGAPTSYALLSSRPAAPGAPASASNDSGTATSYALLSSHAAGPGRG